MNVKIGENEINNLNKISLILKNLNKENNLLLKDNLKILTQLEIKMILINNNSKQLNTNLKNNILDLQKIDKILKELNITQKKRDSLLKQDNFKDRLFANTDKNTVNNVKELLNLDLKDDEFLSSGINNIDTFKDKLKGINNLLNKQDLDLYSASLANISTVINEVSNEYNNLEKQTKNPALNLAKSLANVAESLNYTKGFNIDLSPLSKDLIALSEILNNTNLTSKEFNTSLTKIGLNIASNFSNSIMNSIDSISKSLQQNKLKGIQDRYNQESLDRNQEHKEALLEQEKEHKQALNELNKEEQEYLNQIKENEFLTKIQNLEDDKEFIIKKAEFNIDQYKNELNNMLDLEKAKQIESKINQEREKILKAKEDKALKEAQVQKEKEQQEKLNAIQEKKAQKERQFQYDKAMMEFNYNKAKLDATNKLESQKNEIAIQNFKTNQALQISNATIQGAIGIASAWASSMIIPPPVGQITAGILTALLAGITATQIGIISSQRAPARYKNQEISLAKPDFKLASGGIVLNKPFNFDLSRSIIGQAGERGAEAVIPLQDSKAINLLKQSGLTNDNITININVNYSEDNLKEFSDDLVKNMYRALKEYKEKRNI